MLRNGDTAVLAKHGRFLDSYKQIGRAPMAPASEAWLQAAACPVTKAPDPPFLPPQPYRANPGTGGFLFGTPALWAVVFPHWRVHGPGGSKLPYFRQGYDSRNERNPDLTVVARRLDGPDQTVHAGPANSASFNGAMERMFMVTGLDIPAAGCWEIAARYATAPDKIQTLSYTVWVEP